MTYGSKSSWKPWRWVRFDLLFSMKDIYINFNLNPLIKLTTSSRNIEFKNILPWKISQMITKVIPISTRKIIISFAVNQGIPFWICWTLNRNWDNHMIRICQWRESHCRANISTRIKKEIHKSRTVRVTVRDLGRKVNHISEVNWDRKIYQVYQFHQNRLASPYDGRWSLQRQTD